MTTAKTKIAPAKTILAILIPILELVLGSLVSKIQGTWAKILLTDLVFLIGMLVLLGLYGGVLKKDWPKFKAHIWRNLLLAILGMIVLYGVLAAVRNIPGLNPKAATLSMDVLSLQVSQTSLITLVGSLTTLMAPFSEEIVFRHVLFYQWRGRKALTGILFCVSAIAFGLVHWQNFNGDIRAMVPYMAVGAVFNLIYLWSKNIWQSIATHFFFDFLSVLGAIALVIIQIIR